MPACWGASHSSSCALDATPSTKQQPTLVLLDATCDHGGDGAVHGAARALVANKRPAHTADSVSAASHAATGALCECIIREASRRCSSSSDVSERSHPLAAAQEAAGPRAHGCSDEQGRRIPLKQLAVFSCSQQQQCATPRLCSQLTPAPRASAQESVEQQGAATGSLISLG